MKDLRQHAVGVACEDIAQCRGRDFCNFELADTEADKRSAKFDHDARIGRQIALADNAADGALAAWDEADERPR